MKKTMAREFSLTSKVVFNFKFKTKFFVQTCKYATETEPGLVCYMTSIQANLKSHMAKKQSGL